MFFLCQYSFKNLLQSSILNGIFLVGGDKLNFENMTESERLKYFRKSVLKTNQTIFGASVCLSQTAIGQMERSSRAITERTYMLLKDKHNLNIEWLKTGIGEPILEPDVFSLDEYAKQRDMREEELEVVKFYLSLDSEIRDTIIERFKSYFGIQNDSGKDLLKDQFKNIEKDVEELEELDKASELQKKERAV